MTALEFGDYRGSRSWTRVEKIDREIDRRCLLPSPFPDKADAVKLLSGKVTSLYCIRTFHSALLIAKAVEKKSSMRF
jgi:hypothetical protein